MPIREATEADTDDIVRLIRALADFEDMADEVSLDPASVARHLFGPKPAAQVLIATEDDATVAGFALWYPTYSTFLGRPGIWLEDLFVDPEHRGRGHGSHLLQWLRDATDGRVEWSVLDWNEAAVDFYESLGARPVPGWTRYRWLPGTG